jgi:hypothetical protein
MPAPTLDGRDATIWIWRFELEKLLDNVRRCPPYLVRAVTDQAQDAADMIRGLAEITGAVDFPEDLIVMLKGIPEEDSHRLLVAGRGAARTPQNLRTFVEWEKADTFAVDFAALSDEVMLLKIKSPTCANWV